MVKKKRVERTRANNTLTEAQFWAMIRSTLRNKSRWWKPISICKAKHRRPYKGTNKRQKFEYQCNKCKQWFPEKGIAVHHLVPVGTLTKAEDLPIFVENLFCEVDGLIILCDNCHANVHKQSK